MSIATKRKLAKTIGVPVKYIKAKDAKSLLTIYKKCMSKDLPLPPIGMKLRYKNKLYGVPRTRLGKKLYASVFLEARPKKTSLIEAAKLMKVKKPEELIAPILHQTLVSKMIARGFREPILIMTLKKRKVVVIRKNTKVNLSPQKRVSNNAKFVTTRNEMALPDTIKINKTTTVIHKASKKHNDTMQVKRPNDTMQVKRPNDTMQVKRPNMPRNSNDTMQVKRPNMPRNSNDTMQVKRPNMPRNSNDTMQVKRPNMPRNSNDTMQVKRPNMPRNSNDTMQVKRPNMPRNSNDTMQVKRPNDTMQVKRPNDTMQVKRPNMPRNSNDTMQVKRPNMPRNSNDTMQVKRPNAMMQVKRPNMPLVTPTNAGADPRRTLPPRKSRGVLGRLFEPKKNKLSKVSAPRPQPQLQPEETNAGINSNISSLRGRIGKIQDLQIRIARRNE